jgi:hypothetical protein
VVLKVKKEDAAYLYQILESYEGLTNFSTLDAPKEDPYRQILLHLPPDSESAIATLIQVLQGEIWLERIA